MTHAPRPTPTPETPNESRERPGGVNGIWFIGITLSLFIIIPAIVIGVSKLSYPPKALPPLIYSERHHWPAQELRSRELEYDMFVAAETGKRYRKANFPLEPDDEAMLNRAVRLVQQDDFFESEGSLAKVIHWVAQHPTQFYPCYLAAQWLLHNDRGAEAEHWRAIAFERATGAIVQQLNRTDGQPAAYHTLPNVAIAYDRVHEGVLNTTLMLIYPAPTSDETGQVYLPTFESIYRLTDPTLPPGATSVSYPRELTLLPQNRIRNTPNWFSAPYRVGRLPGATVSVEE